MSARNLAADLEQLRTRGYLIIEGALPASECDLMVAAIERIAAEHGIGPRQGQSFSGSATVRIMNLLQYDRLFEALPLHSDVLPLAEQYLDRECLLSGYTSSIIGPGEAAQPLHADNWWLDGRRFDFPFALGGVVALTDFTEANGATRLVPGSHRWKDIRYPMMDSGFGQVPGSEPIGHEDWPVVVAEAPKGSYILYDTQLIHAAGANRTDQPRPSLITQYIVGWARQLHNFVLGTPMERMRDFDPRLQQLIGLDRYRGGWATVNLMPPARWLWDRPAEQQLSTL